MLKWKHNNNEGHLYLSSALTLQLNEGDLAYIQPPSGYSPNDDRKSLANTFSGLFFGDHVVVRLSCLFMLYQDMINT